MSQQGILITQKTNRRMIADRIGHINTVIITGFLAGCSAFLIWTFAYNFVSLVFFAAIFGFFGGAFVTLGPSTTAIITGMDRFKSGYSLFLLVTVVAMFGPNLAGALEAYFTTHYNQEPYLTYKLFTGVGYILGVLIMVVLKWRIHRGRLFSKLWERSRHIKESFPIKTPFLPCPIDSCFAMGSAALCLLINHIDLALFLFPTFSFFFSLVSIRIMSSSPRFWQKLGIGKQHKSISSSTVNSGTNKTKSWILQQWNSWI